MPRKVFRGYVAGVTTPSRYQASNGTKWEIIVRPTTTAIDTEGRKVVAQILRAAKIWDGRARKWQRRVLIQQEIERRDLEFWLYQNFPELDGRRIAQAVSDKLSQGVWGTKP